MHVDAATLAILFLTFTSIRAEVTIYTTFATATDGSIIAPTGVPPAAATLNAYNLTACTPPALPSPMPTLTPTAVIAADPSTVTGLGPETKGNLIGFSIELSVANQILGTNSSRLSVPFLNYIAGLKARHGVSPNIRIGGNSQEAYLLYTDPFANYQVINKSGEYDTASKTNTSRVDVSVDLLYAMRNISALLGTDWYFGLPWATTLNNTGVAEIVAMTEDILGDNLIALQLGNEPDLYGLQNRKRIGPYGIEQYMAEYQDTINNMTSDLAIKNQQILLGPSICCDVQRSAGINWGIQDVIDAGYMTTFNNSLKVLSVQHYPYDNCVGDNPPTAQSIIDKYFSHDMIVNTLVNPYLNASAEAAAANKQFVMFETNTASCAGFVGLSDTFGAALWAVDYSLQMAKAGFSNALFHFGGQNAAYNPFTPPPGTVDDTYQWTTGPLYYAMLAVAEALGPTNTSRVVDLGLNFNHYATPGYAIYENGAPAKALFINYMEGPLSQNGGADYTTLIQFSGGTTPSTVQVRRLSASSVVQKYNITWAGQSMGGIMESDGRLQGDVSTETITCNDQGCPITVYAPSAVLVFLTSDALNNVSPAAVSTATFATTTQTGRYAGGATVDQAVLATSNGRGGKDTKSGGSTSSGKSANSSVLSKGLSIMFGISVPVVLGAFLVFGSVGQQPVYI